MSVMAEETADLKKKFMAGEQMQALLEKRMEELREENNSLRQTVMGKDSEIRHLNDQISELFLKLRLTEQNSVGLLTQIKNQSESEALIVRAQQDHAGTLTTLSERCNKLISENEELRRQLVSQRADLEKEMAARTQRLEEMKRSLEEERGRLVPKEEYARLETTYGELLAKHRKLLKLQINTVLDDKNLPSDKEVFDAGLQLDYLATQIQQLRSAKV